MRAPRVRSFFVDEFARWNDRQLEKRLGSVQNKIGQFLAKLNARVCPLAFLCKVFESKPLRPSITVAFSFYDARVERLLDGLAARATMR